VIMSSFCKLVITAIPFASMAQTNIDELLIKTAGTDKVQSLRKARTAIADRLGKGHCKLLLGNIHTQAQAYPRGHE